MSEEVKGVFVRLPLSEEQAESVLNSYTGDKESTNVCMQKTILDLGTPVTGGKEICSGSVKWHENDREPTLETYVPNAFGKAASVKIVTLSDHQAQIAALEDEVVRLRRHLSSTLEVALSRADGTTCIHLVKQAFSLAKTTELTADEVVSHTLGELFPIMKGGAA